MMVFISWLFIKCVIEASYIILGKMYAQLIAMLSRMNVCVCCLLSDLFSCSLPLFQLEWTLIVYLNFLVSFFFGWFCSDCPYSGPFVQECWGYEACQWSHEGSRCGCYDARVQQRNDQGSFDCSAIWTDNLRNVNLGRKWKFIMHCIYCRSSRSASTFPAFILGIFDLIWQENWDNLCLICCGFFMHLSLLYMYGCCQLKKIFLNWRYHWLPPYKLNYLTTNRYLYFVLYF